MIRAKKGKFDVERVCVRHFHLVIDNTVVYVFLVLKLMIVNQTQFKRNDFYINVRKPFAKKSFGSMKLMASRCHTDQIFCLSQNILINLFVKNSNMSELQ